MPYFLLCYRMFCQGFTRCLTFCYMHMLTYMHMHMHSCVHTLVPQMSLL